MAEKVPSSSALAAALSPTACSSKVANNVARIQRNVAEKQRRDKLNGYISELANIVPMISSSSKRLDKTSILRLSAAYLRICKSPLGGKKN
ncbi:circadian locomoter output cycles protein kaput [Caerostris extrusa]|uniref:Circadian locomoter output cycles protein kaput n=1 Tax=Caerostris extrusa TaxID=172846 RepID=A0AAV4VC56_CAEEX|nr:circadian locomoter output cycles protein kaput [Caerostris extrusa]